MKRYTMLARRPRQLRKTDYRQQAAVNYTSHDDWRIPAEVGASGTATPTSLGSPVMCQKCLEYVELRRMAAHRRFCFDDSKTTRKLEE